MSHQIFFPAKVKPDPDAPRYPERRKTEWPELVGMPLEEARQEIEKTHPVVDAIVILSMCRHTPYSVPGSVRVYVNTLHIVSKVPFEVPMPQPWLPGHEAPPSYGWDVFA